MGGLVDFVTEDVLGLGEGGREAEKTLREGQAIFDEVGRNAPRLQDMRIDPEMMKVIGELDPEMQQVVLQDPSLLQDIVTDPRLRDAQLNALDDLVNIADNDGLDATAKARLNLVNRNAATEERGARDAIIQNANARGIGGSGLELAQKLISNQGSASRRSDQSFDAAAEAEQRALQAIMSSGQLGGQIRGQDFDQDSRVAAAGDAINRFNAANRNTVNAGNVGANNRAAELNLTNKQRVADTNVGIGNANKERNSNLRQQMFDNDLNVAAGRTGNLNAIAGAQQSAGQSRDDFLGAGMQAGGAALAASDERVKVNVGDGNVDVQGFLDSISAKNFNFKDEDRFGEGKQVGVMAQDFEKTPVGSTMVEEGDDGVKRINFGKGAGVLFATLSDLHERVKEIEGRG